MDKERERHGSGEKKEERSRQDHFALYSITQLLLTARWSKSSILYLQYHEVWGENQLSSTAVDSRFMIINLWLCSLYPEPRKQAPISRAFCELIAILCNIYVPIYSHVKSMASEEYSIYRAHSRWVERVQGVWYYLKEIFENYSFSRTFPYRQLVGVFLWISLLCAIYVPVLIGQDSSVDRMSFSTFCTNSYRQQRLVIAIHGQCLFVSAFLFI